LRSAAREGDTGFGEEVLGKKKSHVMLRHIDLTVRAIWAVSGQGISTASGKIEKDRRGKKRTELAITGHQKG